MINYYSILGLTESATDQEIKAAFKKLALKYHPDKHAGDPEMEERFKEINQAKQVLTNPFEKARYDIQLKYGSFTTAETYYQPPPPPPRPPRPETHRPNYTEPKINWRENWIATAYAFGFTFIMAALVMTGISIKNYIDAENLKEKLAERRARFEAAQSDYRIGNVESALSIINDLGTFMKPEKDMKRFKTELFEDFVYQAEHNYNQENYTDAIYYFELLERFSSRNPLVLQEHLAIAYQKVNLPYKAIKKWKELLIKDYRRLETYLRLANIYRHFLNDLDEAKRYYELASDLAIERYKSIYGNAYVLILNERTVPKSHYYLYTELANIYLDTEEPERAIKATKWNKQIWPDSARNFEIATLAYLEMGNEKMACKNWEEASSLGSELNINVDCSL